MRKKGGNTEPPHALSNSSPRDSGDACIAPIGACGECSLCVRRFIPCRENRGKDTTASSAYPSFSSFPNPDLIYPSSLVLLDRLPRPKVLEVHPATGIVHAGEEKKKDSNKARIMVRKEWPGMACAEGVRGGRTRLGVTDVRPSSISAFRTGPDKMDSTCVMVGYRFSTSRVCDGVAWLADGTEVQFLRKTRIRTCPSLMEKNNRRQDSDGSRDGSRDGSCHGTKERRSPRGINLPLSEVPLGFLAVINFCKQDSDMFHRIVSHDSSFPLHFALTCRLPKGSLPAGIAEKDERNHRDRGRSL